jgi:hypothetical protein
MDYGAVNDGKTITTKAIQRAIDDCAAKGGGTIVFPSGKYLSGTLYLKNNIILSLKAGAELLGSSNLDDYPSTLSHFPSYADNYTERSLIFAEQLQNISIIGQGKINGQGFLFEPVYQPYKIRPYIIRMIKCKNILLRDITIVNPAMWTQHYLACNDLTIDNVKVDSWNSNVNNDGIDIDGCDMVRISNCYIKAEDDAIVLKSTSPEPCQNVTISNCVLSSLCNAFKCGTESTGGFENIVVSNCIIIDTRYSGIALEIVDGGHMNNVIISDIVMKDVNNPIFIYLGDRARPYIEGAPKKPAGTMRNIKVSNISATGAGNFTPDRFSDLYKKQNRLMADKEIGSSITGISGSYIENITLSDISIVCSGGGAKDLVNIKVPEKEKEYPEYNMFGNLPSYAFFISHVKGITMNNIDVSYALPDYRPALYLKDVREARIEDFKAMREEGPNSLIFIDNSQKIIFKDCQQSKNPGVLADIQNSSFDISFINNNIFNMNEIYKADSSINKSSVVVK